MSLRYAISDPHGCLDVLGQAFAALDLTGDNHLYLLGDYIPHETLRMSREEYLARSAKALSFVREFQARRRGHVTALLGNHELYLLQCDEMGEVEISPDLRAWLRSLRPYAQTSEQVFVHAGIDERAGRAWTHAYDFWDFCLKVPPSTGAFYKDVVAGHVGVGSLARDREFTGVFWDGQSHYYIDATTERTGNLIILIYDVESRTYQYQIATAQGVGEVMPVVAFAADACE